MLPAAVPYRASGLVQCPLAGTDTIQRLGELVGLCSGPCEFPAIDDQIFGSYQAPFKEVLQNLQRAGSVARLRRERGA